MSNLRIKLEQQIIDKAMKDDSFRKHLLEDPKTAFEQESGITLPASFKITVLQEDQHNVYLILPPFRGDVAEDELSEAELASVAGGTGWGGPGQGS
jgi:hypothetical protein